MNNMAIILNFLKEYKAWVEAGVPINDFFTTEHGLCTNLNQYARSKYKLVAGRLVFLDESLCSLFKEDNLSLILPFNMPMFGQPRYISEVHHENPWRMKWVADTIIKLEGKQNES